MSTLTLLFVIIFIIGLFFYAKTADPKYAENLTNRKTTPKCPNLLIQQGNRIKLYNSKLAEVPGVNPIEFDNLEDYVEFLEWQKRKGIRCPVLYLQESYDPQGNTVYKMRPNILEPQGGLQPSVSYSSNKIIQPQLPTKGKPITYSYPTLLVDATMDNPPYNKNSYPSYDDSPYYYGKTTPLDMMDIKQKRAKISPNPMDVNWGGQKYTQSLIDKGYYKDNAVSIQV
jgi:hypothetical protein